MKTKFLPTVCAALLATSFCLCARAQQVSGPGAVIAFPAILQPATPPEAVEMWRASENNPAALLPYLNRAKLFKTLRDRGVPDTVGIDAPSGGIRDQAWVLSWLAVRRMGDIGTPADVAALEQFADQSDAAKQEQDAVMARLAIERIRSRQHGREAYVREMLSWLETPTLPPNATSRQGTEAAYRVSEAARALGVIGATEAVPLLLAKYEKADRNARFVGVPALVRLGDTRAIKVFRDYPIFGQHDDYFPLEPGQPDVAWAYWQMRTQGMSQAEMVQEMLRSLADRSSVGGVSRILELTGRPVVPALVEALTNPPSGPHPERTQRAAVKVLGNLRAVESVDSLRQLLRNRDNLQDIRASAAHALGQIGDKSALPDLMQAATDNDLGVQTATLDSLGELKDERAEAVLLKAAQEAAHPSARYVAIKALRTAGTAGAIPILEARLSKEPDENVRATIAGTIRKLRGE